MRSGCAAGYMCGVSTPNGEPLADLVTREFTEMHRQFALIHQQFARVDEQFGRVDEQFANVNARLDRLESTVDRIAVEIGALHRRIDHLEARVDARFDDLATHFDDVHRRIERVEQEHVATSEALRRTDRSTTEEQARRELLERRTVELEREIALLRARVDALEQRRPA